MVDVCNEIHCEKLNVDEIEISFVEPGIDKIRLHLNLDEDNVGLVSDGGCNITTKKLPNVTQDYGVVDKGECGMFDELVVNTVSYTKQFSKIPKVFINLLTSDDRYRGFVVLERNIDNFKIGLFFKANKVTELLLTNIVESKCLNLHYSGYGIIVNDGKSLSFINNQSFDGSGSYRYQSIIDDEANIGYSSILSVDGYPMIAYSRKVNNNLILGICNSLSGVGKWTFTTNNMIGLYPNLIVTETRRVSIINYDGANLINVIIDDGVWLSTKIDPIPSLTGIAACNIDKYYILVATKANASSGCRIYFSDPSCTNFKLSYTSNEVWLHIDVGVLFDNRPVVVTASLNGIMLYYNMTVGGEGGWNAVKLTDDIPSELKYLLLGNGDSMIIYYYDNNLTIIYGRIINGNWQTLTLGNLKNISVINTHNGYVQIVGLMNDKLTMIRSANKYQFVGDVKSYKIYWYAVDV